MIRELKTFAAILVSAVTFIAFAGCSPEDGLPPTDSPDTGSPDGSSSATNSLNGTQWWLTEWAVSSLNAADYTITAGFVDGQISGHSGVNSYSGPYQAGPGNSFSVGQIAMTEMAGAESAMLAESDYLALLGEVRTYLLANDHLTLYDSEGNELLGFDPTTK